MKLFQEDTRPNDMTVQAAKTKRTADASLIKKNDLRVAQIRVKVCVLAIGFPLPQTLILIQYFPIQINHITFT